MYLHTELPIPKRNQIPYLYYLIVHKVVFTKKKNVTAYKRETTTGIL